jgi:PelA/Pel-15E family pectate lyase
MVGERMKKAGINGTSEEVVRILKLVAVWIAITICLDPAGYAQSARKIHWSECLWQKDAWYSTVDAVRIADNLLLYQFPSGGWPKNIDMAAELSVSEKEYLKGINHLDSATIDNSSTYPQLRYLARVYNATKLDRFKEPFLKGFDYLLRAQYANGGWPQFFPLREGYYSHITFNDDAMIGVMKFLKDVTGKKSDFDFVDDGRKMKAAEAVRKGIDCILRCQIRDAGTLVAWCAQHDERDFSPAKARTYELPSLSGEESVGIIEFLMTLDNPSDDIKNSVQGAVAWFKKVEIKGIKELVVDDTLGPGGKNRIVVEDPSAPPMWGRFYEIGSNRPFFCSRDGIKRFSLSEISYERRNHYSWLGYWPQRMLSKEYPEWAKRLALKNVLE